MPIAHLDLGVSGGMAPGLFKNLILNILRTLLMPFLTTNNLDNTSFHISQGVWRVGGKVSAREEKFQQGGGGGETT